jgi:hypothetical protein
VGFFNLLTGPELIEVTEAHLPGKRHLKAACSAAV